MVIHDLNHVSRHDGLLFEPSPSDRSPINLQAQGVPSQWDWRRCTRPDRPILHASWRRHGPSLSMQTIESGLVASRGFTCQEPTAQRRTKTVLLTVVVAQQRPGVLLHQGSTCRWAACRRQLADVALPNGQAGGRDNHQLCLLRVLKVF